MITASTKQFGIRLDNAIADEYIAMAEAKGVSPTTLLRELLTQNVHLALFKMEIYKLEMSLSEHTKHINEATKKFASTEQMQRDIAQIFYLVLWLIREQGCSREALDDLKQRAKIHYENNYKKHI